MIISRLRNNTRKLRTFSCPVTYDLMPFIRHHHGRNFPDFLDNRSHNLRGKIDFFPARTSSISETIAGKAKTLSFPRMARSSNRRELPPNNMEEI